MTEPQNTPEQGAEQIRDTGGVIDLTAQIAARDPGLADRIAALESAVRAERAPREPDPIVRTGARALADIDPSPPPPLLIGRLDPAGHTILFGPGGSGKGTISASWIVDLARADQRVLIVDLEDHPEEWARRITSLGGADIAAAVTIVRPYSPAWQGARGTLEQMADDLRELAGAVGATIIVIDSAGMAGGDPLKPEAPMSYGRALQRIGLTALTIAHVPKNTDMVTPFGSVFWHNLARVTWSLAPQGEDAGHTVLLTCRKANGYAKPGRELLTVTYDDRGLPRDVLARSYAAVLADRIADVLDAATDPLSPRQIVDALADDDDGEQVKADTVRKTLRRGLTATPQRWTCTGTGQGQRWVKA